MQPERMVEARAHELLLEQAAPVRHQRGVEQRHVGRVGEHALVDRGIVRQLAGRADPDVEFAVFGISCRDSGRIRPGAARSAARARNSAAPAPASRQDRRADLRLARQILGRRHVRHRGLMLEARLVVVERHHQGEDRLPVLDRDHAPRGEALAVADAIHLVDDRHLRIAADQEVGVHRMRRAALDGAARRDQRLPDHLAAEHALPAILRRAAAKQIQLRAARC